MPSLDQLVAPVAFTLLVVVMVWFALGTQRNIRRGNEVLRWLQGGLPLIGRRTTLRWLGSSAVELRITDPEAPFREASVVVVLEPRDLSLIWAFSRARGRRDFMIVRGTLQRAPRFSLDAGDPRGWTGRPDPPGEGERAIDWPDGGEAVAGPGADEALVRAAWQRLREASDGVWRLTIQPVVPHLEVHLRPPVSRGLPSERVIGPIRDLADALLSPR